MCFYRLTGQQALAQVQADITDYQALSAPGKKPFPLWIPGVLAAMAGIVLLVLKLWIPGGLLLAAGVGLVFAQSILAHKHTQASLERTNKQQAISSRYGGGSPEDWLSEARLYQTQLQEYETALQQHDALRQQATEKIRQLDQALEDAADGMGFSAAVEYFTAALRQHDALSEAIREQQQALNLAQALRNATKPVNKPEQADTLDLSQEETARQLDDAAFEQKQLQMRLGQCQGRMETLGSVESLQAQLDRVNGRLTRLNETYTALELALHTLEDATAQLQRRFAPRIAQQAQELFAKLTGGRYDRLMLQQDLSVNVGAEGETVLRAAQWRSEGTVDQLYLALRLAVARELTPAAPLILDDALVRFDDTRHGLAMDVLRQEAEQKQVILFTCQSRENA